MTDWSEASRGFGGTIADFPLTSVLQILELGKKSGFLYVRSFPRIAFLCFRVGGVVQAVSSLRRVGLGELLIAEGRIRREDLSHALDIQKRAPKKKMLGEIFEALGMVTHEQVIEVLRNQMKEIVRWVLEWKEGEFTFYAGKEAQPEMSSQEEEMMLPVGIVVQEVLKGMLDEKDRRRFPRVPVSLKVVVRDQEREQTFYTRDVSGGGLFVLSEHPPEVGKMLDCSVWIPTLMEPARVTCQVVRIENPPNGQRGFGVEFRQIEPEAQETLEKLGKAFGSIL